MGRIAFTIIVALVLTAGGVQASVPPDAVPTIPPATIDDTLDVVGDSLDATQVKTRMFIDVSVNDQGPFRFVVDSGADRSVIGLALAKRLALPAGHPVVLQGMAGASRVDTVVIDHIKLGPSIIDDIVAPALPERFLGAQGLIGIDALADQRLLLDFEARTVTIQDSRRPAHLVEGEIVVTAWRRKGQLILTQASVADRRIYAVIDTGAEITMGNSALARRIFGTRAPPPQPVTLISVTGQAIEANLAVLPRMRIGGVLLNNVPVAFVDAPPFRLFGLDTQPAILLGTDVLESFRRVSLDFRARKVRFVLRR